jgi:eukaryotic-like serine/threonine-protein kinase
MKFRRHPPVRAPRGPEGSGSGAGRLLRYAGIIAAVFAVGYAVAFVLLTPGPLMTKDHAVPRVLGLALPEARQQLEGLGLRVRLVAELPHRTIGRGAVVWQDPPPDVVLPEGRTVELSISTGVASGQVPDVVGLAGEQAQSILQAAGFRIGAIDSLDSRVAAGFVVATRPAPGMGRTLGGTVELVVSAGSRSGPGPLGTAGGQVPTTLVRSKP